MLVDGHLLPETPLVEADQMHLHHLEVVAGVVVAPLHRLEVEPHHLEAEAAVEVEEVVRSNFTLCKARWLYNCACCYYSSRRERPLARGSEERAAIAHES